MQAMVRATCLFRADTHKPRRLEPASSADKDNARPPAGSLFSLHSPAGTLTSSTLTLKHRIKTIQYKLNKRPREKINFGTPKDRFYAGYP